MTRSSPLKTILLDLDGAFVDPAQGIVGACRHALERLGAPAGPTDDLRWVIGPPLRESFATLPGGRADPEAALALYRTRYAERGLFETAVYQGVSEALVALRAQGLGPLVCTPSRGSSPSGWWSTLDWRPISRGATAPIWRREPGDRVHRMSLARGPEDRDTFSL